ncbi:MAG: sensor histidine kinase [Firmicutes bacterium]|nr:sensor histidine kinase [Bacillota bacterium]MCL5040268.1 sensor histidine kinase [Bacillota bacterium]
MRPLPLWARILMVAVSVAALAEVKVNPFGTQFRFALGAAAFNFASILDRSLPVVGVGVISGLVVLTLRLLLSLVAWPATELGQAFLVHFPGGLYYLLLALALTGLDFRRRLDQPLPLGLKLILADALANLGEILIRGEVKSLPGAFYFAGIFLMIGFIRTTMVLGLYFVVQQRHLEELQQQERRKYREMLLLATALRNEAFFLKKSSADIEKTMAKSYQLYSQARLLSSEEKGEGPEYTPLGHLSATALAVAKEIHEIKKDYQRIIAGLERLVDPQEIGGPRDMAEVVELALAVNQNYARRLRKEISFVGRVEGDGPLTAPLPLLTILNNLLNNAIEAIPEEGNIEVEITREGTEVLLLVKDTGVGIPAGDREIIFEPGYSTKFRPETGEFYAGIGLTHVRGLVEDLGGRILVSREGGKTVFRVSLPSRRLFCPPDEGGERTGVAPC